MGRSYISRSSATPQKGAVPQCSPILGSTGAPSPTALPFMHTPFDAELRNVDVVTPVGRGLVFLGISHAPPQGHRAQALPNFGVYACTLCRRTTKFDVVTHMGAERISWVATPVLMSQRFQIFGSRMPTRFGLYNNQICVLTHLGKITYFTTEHQHV